jgi:hypothetical protein
LKGKSNKNLIDECGNKYGKLTVLYRATPVGQPVKWHCVCDCGKELDVLGTSLRSGNTKSCGCYQKQRATESNIERSGGNLEGKKFGRLLVLKQAGIKELSDKRKARTWLCKCDCGQEKIVTTNYLNTAKIPSCGCYVKDAISINTVKREEGNRYGLLVVEKEYGRDKNGRVLWKCNCDCGNTKIALGKSLRAGLVYSCGCLHLKGEEKIAKILEELNLVFIRQKNFEDLKSKLGNYLYFDFFLPEYNICIEYQGEQHYFIIIVVGIQKKILIRQKNEI